MYSDLDEEYKHILNDNCDSEDIKFIFKKLGLNLICQIRILQMFSSQTLNETITEKAGIFSNLLRKM